MNNWSPVFMSFIKKTCNFDEYSWAVSAMNLFPPWAVQYWCKQIWSHGSEQTPVKLIQNSPFSSFFFRPCHTPPFVTTLYMQIWCGVHMAYYLYHKDMASAHSFMNNANVSDDFHIILKSIPIFKAGQGDWKCEHCFFRTIKGTLHVCVSCSNPVSSWTKYV